MLSTQKHETVLEYKGHWPSRYGACRYREVTRTPLGCGSTYLYTFPLFSSGMAALLGLRMSLWFILFHFGTQAEISILVGNQSTTAGARPQHAFPAPSLQAWSWGALSVGLYRFFCLNQQDLSPARLNIRFNWGLPAYQRQYGNFYKGKVLARVFPALLVVQCGAESLPFLTQLSACILWVLCLYRMGSCNACSNCGSLCTNKS